MAATDTLTTLNGITKARYADSVINVVPSFAKILKMTKFSKRDRLGSTYNQPVILSNQQGITFGNASGTLPLSLNASVAMNMQNASIASTFFALRGQIGVDAIIRTASKDQGVEDALELFISNMVESESSYIESLLLYGQSGLAKVATTPAFTATSGTVTVVPIADMAPGLWSGKEGAKINFYNSGSLVSSSTDAIFTITAVDVINSTLTVTGTSGGTTTLQALTGTALDIFWVGAYAVEFAGLQYTAGNTGSLYGISAASYSLWGGSTFSAGSGALTFGELQEAVALAVGRGLNQDADVLVSPATWANLLNDQAGLRRYTGSDTAMKNGAGELEFESSNGKLTIIPHGYMKPTMAIIVPDLEKSWKRIGSTELAFNPGVEDPDKYFVMIQDALGYETRLVSDTALFLESAPARCCLITGISNTTN
jgi:hypothetical protein